MIRRNLLSISAMMALSLSLLSGNAVAQQKTLKEQLVGTWSLVSYDSIGTDGSKKAVFGNQPKGVLMFDASGHYAMVLTDPGRPKWKSDLRTQTTPEEFTAAAKGLIAQYGGWSVDEATKTWTRKVEGALSPGLAGEEQKVTVAVSADELKVTTASSGVTGGKTEQVFRHVK
jgi:Lipocalin-like domain